MFTCPLKSLLVILMAERWNNNKQSHCWKSGKLFPISGKLSVWKTMETSKYETLPKTYSQIVLLITYRPIEYLQRHDGTTHGSFRRKRQRAILEKTLDWGESAGWVRIIHSKYRLKIKLRTEQRQNLVGW